ncbi:hypothetical protein DL89DRAFT_272635 [Linderina pennispora]|uniref:Magnesium-dependent phosphatase-1 n=1 Tax=Linderina pennispora TaxID=61395 RepID=A0A1Y1VSB9_9FUNG|nr:uncharacterized protein DL89DRAFT_272635 [Linderina pennispora]ORX64188.1 hypothetical protein DL89DRAFT_272635 [Linderina pennispora]
MTRHSRLLSRSKLHQPTPIPELEALGWDPRKEEAEFLPELIVFDLDFTLWSCWIDTHTNGPPYRLAANNKVKDRYGDTMELFSDVPRHHGPDRAEWAKQVLALFEIQSDIGVKKKKMIECIDFHGDLSGLKAMIFFDDEARNAEVETKLGVRFVHVDDAFGVNWNLFLQHLWSYAEHRKHRQS